MKHLLVICALAVLMSCNKEDGQKTNTFSYSTWDLDFVEFLQVSNGSIIGVVDSLKLKGEVNGYNLKSTASSGTVASVDFYIKNDTIKFLEDHTWFKKNDIAVIKKLDEKNFVFDYDRYYDWASKPFLYELPRYHFILREKPYESKEGCATCWQTLSNNERFINGFANNGFDFISDSKLGILCGQELANKKAAPIVDKVVGKVTYRTTTFCYE